MDKSEIFKLLIILLKTGIASTNFASTSNTSSLNFGIKRIAALLGVSSLVTSFILSAFASSSLLLTRYSITA